MLRVCVCCAGLYSCTFLCPSGTQIYRSEDSLSSFAFLEDGAHTAIVGLWDGTVAVVDRRTPGTSPELSADIGFKMTRTVDVHPVDKQYFLAAGSVYVAQNTHCCDPRCGHCSDPCCNGLCAEQELCWVVLSVAGCSWLPWLLERPIFSPQQHLK